MANSTNMLQLCRLCLVKDDVNIPIFEEQGDIRQIFLKISSCLPVKVSREDRLPKKICDGCSYKLDMLYEFWNTSANAEKQLLSWLGEAGVSSKMADGAISAMAQQMKPTEAFVKEETLEPADLHAAADEDEKEYLFEQQKVEESASAGPSATVTSNEEDEPPPKRARRTAAVKAAIAMDQDSDDDDDSGEPLTKVEDESEDSDGEDHVPAFVDVPSTSADDQPGPSGVGKDGVEAPIPKTESKSKPKKIANSDAKHRKKTKKSKISTPKPSDFLEAEITIPKQELPDINENHLKFACEICDEKIESSLHFAIHSISHSSDKKYHCHYCKHKSSTLKRISKHMRAHGDPTETFKCELCGATFPEIAQASEHKNIHSGEMPYHCSICEKHFMFSWLLFTHRRLFHADDHVSASSRFCDICQMSFGTKSGLTKHMFRKHSKHPKENPLCDVCGKTLANSETLKFHKRTHTGEKPYTCSTCGKSFRKKGLLVEHERIHTGEKPFACQYCDKAFAQRAPLKIHRRIHTGERPYICRLCGKGCICKSVLDSHMKSCSGMILV